MFQLNQFLSMTSYRLRRPNVIPNILRPWIGQYSSLSFCLMAIRVDARFVIRKFHHNPQRWGKVSNFDVFPWVESTLKWALPIRMHTSLCLSAVSIVNRFPRAKILLAFISSLSAQAHRLVLANGLVSFNIPQLALLHKSQRLSLLSLLHPRKAYTFVLILLINLALRFLRVKFTGLSTCRKCF